MSKTLSTGVILVLFTAVLLGSQALGELRERAVEPTIGGPTGAGVLERVDIDRGLLIIDDQEYSVAPSLAVTGLPESSTGMQDLEPGMQIFYSIAPGQTFRDRPVIHQIHVPPL